MTYLFPLGDQLAVGVALFQQKLVQLLADRVPLVVNVVDVARALVVKLEDWPLRLDAPLALVRVILGCRATPAQKTGPCQPGVSEGGRGFWLTV